MDGGCKVKRLGRTVSRLTLVGFLAGVQLGCTNHMDDDLDSIRAVVGDLEDENRAHAEICAKASTLDEVAEESARHQAAMNDLASEMDDALADVDHCFQQGMEDLMGAARDLVLAVELHALELEVTGAVDDAHAYCESHDGRVSRIVSDLDATVADIRGTLTCRH